MSNTFNFNATNQQNQIGDNNTQNMTVQGGLSLEGFLTAIENIVKQNAEPAPAEVTEEVAYGETVTADVRNTAYDAEGKDNYDIEHTQSVLERFQAFIGKAGPKLTKALIAFGTETATAYIGDNPVVKGVIAAIQALQQPE